MTTVLRLNARHRHTALQFQRWLFKNPDAGLKRQVAAFNAIADSEYRQELQEASPKPKKVVKKATKRI